MINGRAPPKIPGIAREQYRRDAVIFFRIALGKPAGGLVKASRQPQLRNQDGSINMSKGWL